MLTSLRMIGANRHHMRHGITKEIIRGKHISDYKLTRSAGTCEKQ